VCAEEVEDEWRWFGNVARLFTHEIEQSGGVGLAEVGDCKQRVSDPTYNFINTAQPSATGYMVEGRFVKQACTKAGGVGSALSAADEGSALQLFYPFLD